MVVAVATKGETRTKTRKHVEFYELAELRRRQIEWTSRIYQVASRSCNSSRGGDTSGLPLSIDNSRFCLRGLFRSEVIMLATSCQCNVIETVSSAAAAAAATPMGPLQHHQQPPPQQHYNQQHQGSYFQQQQERPPPYAFPGGPVAAGAVVGEWSRIFLMLPTEQYRMDQSHILKQRVSQTTFQGIVVLICDDTASAAAAATTTTPASDNSMAFIPPFMLVRPGLHSNLLVSHSVIHLDARVQSNGCIQHTYVGPQAVVMQCGTVQCSSSSNTTKNQNIYNQLSITVGAETGGGRPLTLDPEATMIDVCQQIVKVTVNDNEKSKTNPIVSADDSKKDERDNTTCLTILCGHSVLRNTPTIDSVFLYPQATIDAATTVTRAVLYPYAEINHGSSANHVALQWNSKITTLSVVSDTLLMEHGVAGPKSIVASSVLGPDVHVSAGEVHASVIGPNSNAHHQSLVISVLWPLGRGNVGYGANVGSNHTGRLPDQETTSGEGLFWGLSSVIKFPVDFSSAPYSIVAAGTIVGPQRVTFPFSLILDGGGSSNHILPGWLLSSSPYTIVRSEKKYATRRKAIHHDSYTGWKIIRRETIDLCFKARQRLRSIDQQQQPNGSSNPMATETKKATTTKMYSSRQIPGLGANELTEKGRVAGIKAYSDAIQLFALRGLVEFLQQQHHQQSKNGTAESLGHQQLQQQYIESLLANEFQGPVSTPSFLYEQNSSVEWNPWPWNVNDDESAATQWLFQKQLLLLEFPLQPPPSSSSLIHIEWVTELLRHHYIKAEKEFLGRVLKCKQRDDVRGKQTIPGYADFHTLAEDDSVIADVTATTQTAEQSVVDLLHNFMGQKTNSKM